MHNAVAGRSRAAQEQAILSAWWAMRIEADAQHGPVSIDQYLDELLSEDELLEKSSAALAAHFDALIETGGATPQ